MDEINLKEAWAKFDRGDSITDPELQALMASVQAGIVFLEARGEHGGVLFKALLNRERLYGYFNARLKP